MLKKLSVFIVLTGIIFLTQISFAQDSPPDPDYVLFYIERDEGGFGWGNMIRTEFVEGRITYDYRILDFRGQSTEPPAISPDGESIYLITKPPFAYNDAGYLPDQIYAVSTFGNNFRSISPDDRYYRGMSFSPDGGQLALFTNAVTDAIGFGLAFMDVDGTNRRELGYGGNYFANITWSPDGSQVAMPRNDREILVIDVVSGDILATKENIRFASGLALLSWGADGNTLYFAGSDSDEMTGIYSIYAYNIADNTLTVFYDERNITEGSAIISPDKTRLASFTRDDERITHLTVFDVATGDIVQDVVVDGYSNEYEDGPLAWTTDGAFIAFTQRLEAENDNPQVFVLNVADGDVQRISPSDYGAVYPMWLPQ